MATTPPIMQEQIAAPAKISMASLMPAIVLGVVVSVATVGGAGYVLIHSGKLRLQTMPQTTAVPVAQKTHSVLLEPLVVNLADGSGASYLRVSIALSVADHDKENKPEDGEVQKGADAVVRDTALEVFSRETSDGLLAADGKERTKKSLRDALAQRVPEMKIVDLYFTEFLVQR